MIIDKIFLKFDFQNSAVFKYGLVFLIFRIDINLEGGGNTFSLYLLGFGSSGGLHLRGVIFKKETL